MSLLNARYVIKLVATNQKDTYSLVRVAKQGNSPVLNRLFVWQKNVEFKRLEPTGIADDYLPFPIIYGEKEDRQILLLETASFLYPFGVVNTQGSSDCILFRISDDLTIEFFVSEGNANLTAQLLTMLVDGSLSGDINNLI